MLTRKQLEDAANCRSNICTSCCMLRKDRNYTDRGCEDNIIDAAMTCAEQAAQTALAYRAMLERLEWAEIGDREGEEEMIPAILCPSCDSWKEDGHKPDCELAALLKNKEG